MNPIFLYRSPRRDHYAETRARQLQEELREHDQELGRLCRKSLGCRLAATEPEGVAGAPGETVTIQEPPLTKPTTPHHHGAPLWFVLAAVALMGGCAYWLRT